MDYQKLNMKHKIMMKFLYSQLRKTPEEKRSPEIRAMLETYHRKVDFVDYESPGEIAARLEV